FGLSYSDPDKRVRRCNLLYTREIITCECFPAVNLGKGQKRKAYPLPSLLKMFTSVVTFDEKIALIGANLSCNLADIITWLAHCMMTDSCT
uniref:Uncharacterized protein n=1 Tax=Aegilops tauschii subsp. strangulata TaxID=200361 RepID=A0A453C0M6_AEGTS